jgi:hypothetical protein
MQQDKPDTNQALKPWYCQTWLIVAILIFGAFRFGALVQEPVCDNPRYWMKVADWLHLLMPLSFAIIMWRAPSNGQSHRPVGRRLLHCVLLGWYIQVAIRSSIVAPALLTLAIRGHSIHDGVGGNVATLMFGWLSSLILVFPFAVVTMVLNWLRSRKNRNGNHGLDSGSIAS